MNPQFIQQEFEKFFPYPDLKTKDAFSKLIEKIDKNPKLTLEIIRNLLADSPFDMSLWLLFGIAVAHNAQAPVEKKPNQVVH